jgi:hypothetical protein
MHEPSRTCDGYSQWRDGFPVCKGSDVFAVSVGLVILRTTIIGMPAQAIRMLAAAKMKTLGWKEINFRQTP